MPTVGVMSNGYKYMMHYLSDEHGEPHIHIYNKAIKVATISLLNGKIIEGDLDMKLYNEALQWMLFHKQELLDMWYNDNKKRRL